MFNLAVCFSRGSIRTVERISINSDALGPKSITINRYPFHGPYATPTEADRKVKHLKTS